MPHFISSYSPVEIALGRYLFYGGISLLLLLKARLQGFCSYPLSVWIKVGWLLKLMPDWLYFKI